MALQEHRRRRTAARCRRGCRSRRSGRRRRRRAGPARAARRARVVRSGCRRGLRSCPCPPRIASSRSIAAIDVAAAARPRSRAGQRRRRRPRITSRDGQAVVSGTRCVSSASSSSASSGDRNGLGPRRTQLAEQRSGAGRRPRRAPAACAAARAPPRPRRRPRPACAAAAAPRPSAVELRRVARRPPRSSSTCPTRRASSSALSRFRCCCESQSSRPRSKRLEPREIELQLEALRELPEQRRAVRERRAGELGEVVEQRLGRVALAAQLRDRRRALALRQLRARRPTQQRGVCEPRLAQTAARRNSSSCLAVFVRWSSPRMTWVISISASSTAVASWYVAVPSERTTRSPRSRRRGDATSAAGRVVDCDVVGRGRGSGSAPSRGRAAPVATRRSACSR